MFKIKKNINNEPKNTCCNVASNEKMFRKKLLFELKNIQKNIFKNFKDSKNNP